MPTCDSPPAACWPWPTTAWTATARSSSSPARRHRQHDIRQCDGFLDFRYTIFGKLIAGDNVRQAIAATPVDDNSSGEDSQPVTPVTIQSMSIVTSRDAATACSMLTAARARRAPTRSPSRTAWAAPRPSRSTSAPIPTIRRIPGSADQRHRPDHHCRQYGGDFTPQGESADSTAVAGQRAVVPARARRTRRPTLTTRIPAPTRRRTHQSGHDAHARTAPATRVTPTSGFYGVQVLEVTAQSATAASWDSTAGVNPVYRAFVPVYVDPPAPQIASISVGRTDRHREHVRQQLQRRHRTFVQYHGSGRRGHGFGLYGLPAASTRRSPRERSPRSATTITLTTTAGTTHDRRRQPRVHRRTVACHPGSRYLRRLDRRVGQPIAGDRVSRFRPVRSAARFRQPPH